MNIGKNLKALQDKAGITTAQLAEKANLPVDTINKIRSGATRNPNADTIQRLATALGVPAGSLLGEVLPETASPADGHDRHMLNLYLAGLARQKEAYEGTVAHLERNSRRWFFIAIALILFIMLVLLWDITHPTMGYVQY